MDHDGIWSLFAMRLDMLSTWMPSRHTGSDWRNTQGHSRVLGNTSFKWQAILSRCHHTIQLRKLHQALQSVCWHNNKINQQVEIWSRDKLTQTNTM